MKSTAYPPFRLLAWVLAIGLIGLFGVDYASKHPKNPEKGHDFRAMVSLNLLDSEALARFAGTQRRLRQALSAQPPALSPIAGKVT